MALTIIGGDRLIRLDADEADLAVQYARSAPRGASQEIFRDRFYPICHPRLLAGRVPIRSAGDGVAILSDIVVADDLAASNLVKVLDLALPGYGFYPVYSPDHPRRAVIETFINWLRQTA